MNSLHHLVVALILPALILADHISVPDHDLHHLKCDMECHNNGVCRFFAHEQHDLQKRMQSGHLVQECICPMGYRGMSCDVDVQTELRCMANQDAKECDCAAADKISAFAGQQCRKPFTEYCASLSNSVGGHISFCTNGGKCRGDLIAAAVAPGNTANNYVFQHTGCVCPPEFIGEHCELLNVKGIYHPELHQQYHPIHNPDSYSKNSSHNNNSGSKVDKGSIAVLLVCVGALTILGVILARKLRFRPFALRRRNPGVPPVSVVALNGYKDGPTSSQNLKSYRDEGYDSADDGKLPELA
ncbi:EGF [Seminavis robusta]|uniref:EGF n=1 Tax=Seminavis robusta TaxID=568900 RepID=A0A9N8DXZ6_9STRA|nr:EGF [Seminavis robusta]|eukprot:Sro462_g148050.1 EGF (299) ;mRNA; f:54723-55716